MGNFSLKEYQKIGLVDKTFATQEWGWEFQSPEPSEKLSVVTWTCNPRTGEGAQIAGSQSLLAGPSSY